jgi:acetylornithine deacetylase/succinyl-diaminopimelate desuccinylase-like protein
MTMKLEVQGKQLEEYIKDCRGEFETRLKKLVDIPSVSMDPARKEDMQRCAEAASEMLRESGFRAEIIQTPRHPVVFGEYISSPEHPTVLVYNHLDVQPADADEWNSPPFEMKIQGDSYLGRGSTDDKGPALTVLYAAQFVKENKLPLNIKFLWELEEEIGSPNFEKCLEENKDKFKADSIVVSDTIWISRDKPAIGYGLRGLQGMLVRLKTGKKDVHSGLTGGLARNPIGELAGLISKAYDARTGKVNIPGFYDDVRQLNAQEEKDFASCGFTVEGFKKAHELLSTRTDDNLDGSRRIWAQPTLEVHGITGGYSGPGVKTIVPHQAEAKISMRLVPNQTPEKIAQLFTDYVKKELPDAEVLREGSLSPYVGDRESAHAHAAKKAMADAFGIEPVFVREGGSIGAVVSMKNVLGKDVIFLGLSLPEHGYHAINENYDWQQTSGGIKMFVNYFEACAKLK